MKKKNENEQLPLAGTEEGEILARLSERVEKAVAMIQELRRERDSLRAKLEEAESRLRESDEAAARATELEEESDRFRRERTEIRTRIEGILGSLEALETTAD